MIITVTMNPAIDRTLEIDSLVRGGLNRIGRVEYDAGGKGINVSRTIRELGGKTIATGFLGGNSGRIIADILKAEGIESDFVQVNGETRTNTKVCEKNGVLTELNEPGPLITEKQVEELKDKLLRYAGTGTLFVLSGSIPVGVTEDTYAKIIRMIHEKGAEVLLDADGNAFRLGLEALPDIIKPNCAELEEYAGMTCGLSEEGIIKTAEEFRKKGIGTVAVSMGQSGALFLLGGKKGEVSCAPGEGLLYGRSGRCHGGGAGPGQGPATCRRRDDPPLYGSVRRSSNYFWNETAAQRAGRKIKKTGYDLIF